MELSYTLQAYHIGGVAELVGGLSYTAVRNAFIALRRVYRSLRGLYRRCIAVDETKSKLGGEQLIIWAARDVDTKEILAFRVSFTRSSLDAELFLKDKPLFLVDKGPWVS